MAQNKEIVMFHFFQQGPKFSLVYAAAVSAVSTGTVVRYMLTQDQKPEEPKSPSSVKNNGTAEKIETPPTDTHDPFLDRYTPLRP
jgi:hypothetical protein